MKRARDELGAESVEEWKAHQPSGSSSFGGAGRSLSGETTAAAPAPAKPKEHTITFWQNGFTIDDGPLRNMQDPESAAFMADINRGRMPAELLGPDGEGEGDVHLLDKSSEPYQPPKAKPFSGEGRSMRDGAAPSGGGSEGAPEAAALSLDTAQPTTTLQVRLHDGTRVVVKANLSHTVGQLFGHVASLTPGGGAFALATTFPRKQLTEMGQTLEQAGLANQTLVQTQQ